MAAEDTPARGGGALAVGTQFAGYTIEAIAGRGGMGVVYRAHQSRPSRTVALKVISPQLAAEPGFRERFAHESEIAASIEHSNVIPVYEVGEESGLLFIAMRYVEGTDLARVIATEGRLPLERAVQILSELTGALDAAHAKGLVHRDVKPANVLLTREGGGEHLYLADFGLAKLVDSRGQTRTGVFLGTLDYAAPEQLAGQSVDARTDVYAAGCVLYHMLTGSVPFPREGEPAIMWAHMSAEPPSARARVPDLPGDLDAVIARAMAKNPDDRYPSAGDLGRAARAAGERGGAGMLEPTLATGAAVQGGRLEPTVVEMAGRGEPPAAAAAPPSRTLSPRTMAIVGAALAGVALVLVLLAVGLGGGTGSRSTSGSTGASSSPSPPAMRQYANAKLGVSFSYPASWTPLTLAGAIADFGTNTQSAATETRCALVLDRGAGPSDNTQESQFAYVRARSAAAARAAKHYELRAIQAEQAQNILGVGLLRVADGQGGHLGFFFRGRDVYEFDCITPAATLDQVDQQAFRPLLASVRIG